MPSTNKKNRRSTKLISRKKTLSMRSDSSSIRAVALAANVSVATVSRAINGTAAMRPETKKRVLEAAEKLGYTASAQARAMRWGPVDSIGWMMSPSVQDTEDDGWIADAAVPLFSAASQHNFSLIPQQLTDDGKGGIQNPEAIRAGRIGGAILMGEFTDCAMLQLQRWNIPLCFWDTNIPVEDSSFINILSDAYEGTCQAINYLYELGHRRIGFVYGSLRSNQPRLQAYHKMVGKLKLDSDTNLTVQVQDDEQNYCGGLHATRQLIALKKAPTAICLATNWYAVGALAAACECNIKVPDQLSIVAMSDGYLSHQCDPKLTGVKNDMNAMAKAAMEKLGSAIHNIEIAQRKIIIAPQLMVRQSTAPVD